MTDIDPLQRLVGNIRAALAQKSARASGSGRATSAGTKQSRSTSGKALSPLELRTALQSNLKALGPLQDANARHRARQTFVQWAVLGELGFELANSAQFLPLLDHITSTMESDPPLVSELDTVIDRLIT